MKPQRQRLRLIWSAFCFSHFRNTGFEANFTEEVPASEEPPIGSNHWIQNAIGSPKWNRTESPKEVT